LTIRRGWLFAGLFCTTLATLFLEILDARLLSVLTWYHLSFLAVSLAMLGMAAGAVHVFLAGAALDGDKALRRLPTFAGTFAGTMALTHVIGLCIPIAAHPLDSTIGFASLTTIIALLTVPFYFSGITVTVALTRARAPIGRLYAWDLAGAAFGCLAVVPLLDSGRFNLSSLVLLGSASAAVGAFCFGKAYARSFPVAPLVIATGLAVAAVSNGARRDGLEVSYPKNRQFWLTDRIERTFWNSHSYVILEHPYDSVPLLWGRGAKSSPTERVKAAWLVIDGEAGTPITGWNGDTAALDWVRHDVTTLPYYLRHGSAAVIGFGGGRDLLAAIWGRSTSVTGVDVNRTMLRLLTEGHRRFAGIADRPEVQLVHDDARAFLTRTPARYDVIQMSLIDTWSSAGAGAFTLTENGLYTTEAWSVILSRLTPTGVFSVSRWFSPAHVSETSRLLALATAALIGNGVQDPLAHTLLVSRLGVATLMISSSPFSAADLDTVERVAADEGFEIQVSPRGGGSVESLDHIARSRSLDALAAATAHPHLDFSPPTDNRPFFFNMLKPASFARASSLPTGGVVAGNIYATTTLVTLFCIATVMVAATIVYPLVATGRPPMDGRVFRASLCYFAGIGLGFMLAQIALLQRFSIYLGHPTHTLSVTLFSMILFAGVGSYLSDRLAPLAPRTERVLPIATAVCLLVLIAVVQPATAATIGAGLLTRSAIVVALLALPSILLGFFFPIGMRMVSALSAPATAWMWGVNGASGVLGSIVAVGVSIWAGIQVNLLLAAVFYASLIFPLLTLQRASLRVQAAQHS
jgi:hypothetical protein